MTKHKLQINDIILSSIVTDKSYKLGNLSKKIYAFQVNKKADKLEIKKAIEKVFNVEVENVNTLRRNTRSKSYKGARSINIIKIAYVSLKSGNIDYNTL